MNNSITNYIFYFHFLLIFRGEVSKWDIEELTAFLDYDSTTKTYSVTYKDIPMGTYETKAIGEASPGKFDWKTSVSIPTTEANHPIVVANKKYTTTTLSPIPSLADVTITIVSFF
jgi:hypothetical protein